jgi:hypothetical protein
MAAAQLLGKPHTKLQMQSTGSIVGWHCSPLRCAVYAAGRSVAHLSSTNCAPAFNNCKGPLLLFLQATQDIQNTQ